MTLASDGPWTLTIKAGASLYAELHASGTDLAEEVNRAVRVFHVPSPIVDVEPQQDLAARDFHVYLGADDLGSFTAPPTGGLIVLDSVTRVKALLGGNRQAEPWTLPLNRRVSATLVMDAIPAKVSEAGLGWIDATLYTATVAGKIACDHLERAIDLFSCAQLLSDLPFYDLVPLLKKVGLDEIGRLLKALVREYLPLTELPAFAPLLADESRVVWSPGAEVVAALPRHLIVPQQRPADDFERLSTIARAVAVPAHLRQLAGGSPLQTWILSEASAAAFAKRKADESRLAAVLAPLADGQGVLVAPAPVREAVAQHARASHPNVRVVVAHELPRGVTPQSRGRI